MRSFTLLGALALGFAVAPASAAPVTKYFHAFAHFGDGPYPRVVLDFGLSFDPTEENYTERPLLYFTSSVTDPAFTGPVAFNNYFDAITMGKPAGGVEGYDFGTNDFTLAFFINPANGGSYLGYTQTAQQDFYTYDVTVTEMAAPAVPEPATWAMMIAGFAVAGTALRYRRRRVSARFA